MFNTVHTCTLFRYKVYRDMDCTLPRTYARVHARTENSCGSQLSYAFFLKKKYARLPESSTYRLCLKSIKNEIQCPVYRYGINIWVACTYITTNY